tara:strand:+ start:97 stop:327 length:231 start_codon:yes stop_codon:yes gene_type:complete
MAFRLFNLFDTVSRRMDGGDMIFTLLEGYEYLSLYKWNKNIAEHYFCKICGVYTHHKRKRCPDQISVNFTCLDKLD